MKTREEVEAELAKDKEPGGVLAWDRNTKHTPTPLVLMTDDSFGGEIHDVERFSHVATLVNDNDCDGELLTSAFNSYAKHCKNPVAAAESDLLGRLITFTKAISDGHYESCPGQDTVADCNCGTEKARALLAETKGGHEVRRV